MKRLVVVFDIDENGAVLYNGLGGGSLSREHWLDTLRTGIAEGVGDALHLVHPVEVIEAMVIEPEWETVSIRDAMHPLAPGIILSGRGR